MAGHWPWTTSTDLELVTDLGQQASTSVEVELSGQHICLLDLGLMRPLQIQPVDWMDWMDLQWILLSNQWITMHLLNLFVKISE